VADKIPEGDIKLVPKQGGSGSKNGIDGSWWEKP
jgi:hypothetical protein